MTHTNTCDNIQKYLSNLDIILASLGIEYSCTSGRYFFKCPIHGSDNYNSLSIYTNTGIWRCFTRHCEHSYGDSFLDFIRAITKQDPIEFCDKVLEGKIESFSSKITSIEKPKEKFKEFERDKLLPFVNPDIPFYLRRGYSKEILEKYDLFICKERESRLYGRIVVPVYDDNRMFVIGLLGRTLHDKCERCGYFHSKRECCPRNSHEYIRFSKWNNSKGFARNASLFNFWFAKDVINTTGNLVLVESPGNCIKLAQAGILNVLGIFGTELTKKQIQKINSLNVKRIFLGLDNDEAGLLACERISEKLKKYECFQFIPPTNDFGDMTIEEIQNFKNSYF
jgi:hypothetical protein